MATYRKEKEKKHLIYNKKININLFCHFISAHLLVRRLRSSARRKFDEIKTQSSKEQEIDDSTQIKYDNNLASKVDIQLQDNGKDKIVDEIDVTRTTVTVN